MKKCLYTLLVLTTLTVTSLGRAAAYQIFQDTIVLLEDVNFRIKYPVSEQATPVIIDVACGFEQCSETFYINTKTLVRNHDENMIAVESLPLFKQYNAIYIGYEPQSSDIAIIKLAQ